MAVRRTAQRTREERTEKYETSLHLDLRTDLLSSVFNRQPSPTKGDTTAAGGGKRAGQASATAAAPAAKGKGASATAGAGKAGATTTGRPGTAKGTGEKTIDASKAYWTLRVVSDADKAVSRFSPELSDVHFVDQEELTIKKDTERSEELINMKKAWETYEAGRAQKAMKARQKFLDSLQPKPDEPPATDGTTKPADEAAASAASSTNVPAASEQQPPASKQAPAPAAPKKSASSTGNKKGAGKDDAAAKQAEQTATSQELIPPPPVIDEPLLDEPPPSKPKVLLPPLDVKPFIK